MYSLTPLMRSNKAGRPPGPRTLSESTPMPTLLPASTSPDPGGPAVMVRLKPPELKVAEGCPFNPLAEDPKVKVSALAREPCRKPMTRTQAIAQTQLRGRMRIRQIIDLPPPKFEQSELLSIEKRRGESAPQRR